MPVKKKSPNQPDKSLPGSPPEKVAIPAKWVSPPNWEQEIKVRLKDIPNKPDEIEARFKDKFFMTELFLAWNAEVQALIQRAENDMKLPPPTPRFQRITQSFQFWADELKLSGAESVSNCLDLLTDFRLSKSPKSLRSSLGEPPTVEKLKEAAQQAKKFLYRLMKHTQQLNAAQPQGKAQIAPKPESGETKLSPSARLPNSEGIPATTEIDPKSDLRDLIPALDRNPHTLFKWAEWVQIQLERVPEGPKRFSFIAHECWENWDGDFAHIITALARWATHHHYPNEARALSELYHKVWRYNDIDEFGNPLNDERPRPSDTEMDEYATRAFTAASEIEVIALILIEESKDGMVDYRRGKTPPDSDMKGVESAPILSKKKSADLKPKPPDQYQFPILLQDIPYELADIEKHFQDWPFLLKLYTSWETRVFDWLQRAENPDPDPALRAASLFPGDDFVRISGCFQTWLDHIRWDGAGAITRLLDGITAFRVGVSDSGMVPSLDEVKALAKEARDVVRRAVDYQSKRITQKKAPGKEELPAKGRGKEKGKEPKDRFSFGSGQVLLDKNDLELKPGETQKVLKKLVDNFGNAVPFKTLDNHSEEHEAGVSLRKAIEKIRAALLDSDFEVENRHGESYLLRLRPPRRK